MQKYRVKSLSVSGKAPRKVYRLNEMVTQANLNAPVDELEKQGFIEKVGDDYVTPAHFEIPEDPFTKKVKKGAKNVVVASVEEEVEEEEEEEEIETETETETEKKEEEDKKDLKRDEIMAELDLLGVKYSKNASKAELFDLYTGAKESNV